jgi:hypothetical protein
MAKATPTTEAAKTPEVVKGSTNLPATTGQSAALATAVDIPDYLKEVDNADGTEGLTREDMVMPRLALAQKMSPEIDPESPKFIEGLEIGDMFNSVHRTIYGDGIAEPIEFVVLKRDAPRHVEFKPLDQGGGIVDMNVPANDPRTMFTRGADGKSVKPIATKFYDFVVMLLPSMEIIGLSFKSTGLKAARLLNTTLATPLMVRVGDKLMPKKVPIYARKFMVRSATGKKDQHTFKLYVVEPSNIPSESSAVNANGDPLPALVSQELFGFLQGYFENFKDQKVVIDIDATPDDDGPDRDQPADPGM